MSIKPKTIAWFSCGAASAVLAKLACEEIPGVEVVYCDTMASEHPDNQRFFNEVQEWIGRPIIKIRNPDHRLVETVFKKTKYMSGPGGARCTTELKKKPRLDYCSVDDTHLFGFTADEKRRIASFEARNPDMRLLWLLAKHGIKKADCYSRLANEGIRLPEMYLLGFRNNNCLGCVKSTSPGYWAKVKKHFPGVFWMRAKQSREIGCRLLELPGKVRAFLDELPDVNPRTGKEWVYKGENLSCGPECGGEQMEMKL